MTELSIVLEKANIGLLLVLLISVIIFVAAILYLVIWIEQGAYEKRLAGRPLPSNRMLNKLTKDIEQGHSFTLEKINGKWVAAVENNKPDQ